MFNLIARRHQIAAFAIAIVMVAATFASAPGVIA